MPEQVTNITGTIWTGVYSGFTRFMNFIPSLFGALIILVAGWYISKFVGRMVERMLIAAKVETAIEKAHISQYLPAGQRGRRTTFSALLGGLAKWFVFLVFVQASTNTLGVAQVSSLIDRVVLFIPHVVVAAVILVAGAWGASYCSGLVERSTSKLGLSGPNMPVLLTKYGILGFATIAAVSQLGIATNLINILFTGLVASLVIAVGLAFGLGGKGAAEDITRSYLKKSRTYGDMLNAKDVGKDDSVVDINHH